MANDDKDQKIKLIELVRDIIQHDGQLRAKYEIAERFRFVKDRLNALLEQLEKHLQASAAIEKKSTGNELSAEDVLVYVYLYNAQGILVPTWLKMLTPKLFFEYSVNRPIYADRLGIETLIRFKANKVQHGFLTVIVKKSDILSSESKDTSGNTMVKIREGGLRFERLVAFSHNEIDYTLSEEGALIRKDPSASS